MHASHLVHFPDALTYRLFGFAFGGFPCGRSYTPQIGGRMYPDYQPRPDDVFHAVGYTSLDISENAHLRLRGLSVRVKMENDMLLQQLISGVGKAKREFVEILSVAPFPKDARPFKGPNNEAFISIEYLSDSALRLCREYGIQHPPVIEKVKRADIPSNHGITLVTMHYSRI